MQAYSLPACTVAENSYLSDYLFFIFILAGLSQLITLACSGALGRPCVASFPGSAACLKRLGRRTWELGYTFI